MRFGLLGALEVRDPSGALLDPGGRKAQRLLTVLLLADGGTVAIDRLVEAVWEGTSPPTAHSTLHSYVSRLRRLLEPEHAPGQAWRLLVSHSPGYRLDVADDEVDAREFVRLADEGRRLLDADEPAKARSALDRALALWRGPALADVGDLEMAAAAAARLEERRLAAREDRFETGLRLGAHAALVDELTAAVAQHPLREGLTERLATALYRCDRQEEALAAVGRLRLALADGAGREPGPRLQELERRIRAKDRSLDAPARIVVADGSAADPDAAIEVPVPRHDAPLVGRTAELDELRAVLAETLAGAYRFALVEGEPGIGKTRLLGEAARRAAAEGATVVWGRCHPGVRPAFGPWLEVLRRLLDTLPPADRHAVQTPALRQLLGATGTGLQGAASAAVRPARRTVRAVRRGGRDAGDRGPARPARGRHRRPAVGGPGVGGAARVPRPAGLACPAAAARVPGPAGPGPRRRRPRRRGRADPPHRHPSAAAVRSRPGRDRAARRGDHRPHVAARRRRGTARRRHRRGAPSHVGQSAARHGAGPADRRRRLGRGRPAHRRARRRTPARGTAAGRLGAAAAGCCGGRPRRRGRAARPGHRAAAGGGRRRAWRRP